MLLRRDISIVVFLASLNVALELLKISYVMFFFQILAIYIVSLQLRILNIEYLIIKLTQIFIRHLFRVQVQVVTQKNLDLFGADVTASIFNLANVSITVSGLIGKQVSILSHHFGNIIGFLFVSVILSLPFKRVVASLRWKTVSVGYGKEASEGKLFLPDIESNRSLSDQVFGSLLEGS